MFIFAGSQLDASSLRREELTFNYCPMSLLELAMREPEKEHDVEFRVGGFKLISKAKIVGTEESYNYDFGRITHKITFKPNGPIICDLFGD